MWRGGARQLTLLADRAPLRIMPLLTMQFSGLMGDVKVGSVARP